MDKKDKSGSIDKLGEPLIPDVPPGVPDVSPGEPYGLLLATLDTVLSRANHGEERQLHDSLRRSYYCKVCFFVHMNCSHFAV